MRYNIPQIWGHLFVLGELVLDDGMELMEPPAWYVNCFYRGTHFFNLKNFKLWKQ
jgi:hypothetical protein